MSPETPGLVESVEELPPIQEEVPTHEGRGN